MITKLYAKADAFLTTYKNDERGVTAIEYGLIAVAMATVLGTIFATTGNDTLLGALKAAYGKITTALTNA